MATRALVLGGTRYFGRRLVEKLLQAGFDVTIATRGNAPSPFGSRARHELVDRSDPEALARLARSADWDLVFDQICYSPDDALSAGRAFEGRAAKYVHTSTASVYSRSGRLREQDFEPAGYPLRPGPRERFDYGEGKRLAEAAFFQEASFPVAAARFPIVLGPDDYTERLEFHVRRVLRGQPIVIPSLEARACFISSEEAAEFLLWLGLSGALGPLNACSLGTISIGEVLQEVQQATGRAARITPQGRDEDSTPFVDRESRYLDPGRAQALGFGFTRLESWFPALVRETARREAR